MYIGYQAVGYVLLKSVQRKLRDPHFFQNCGTCCIEKYHNFERNEDCAIVITSSEDTKRNYWFLLNSG